MDINENLHLKRKKNTPKHECLSRVMKTPHLQTIKFLCQNEYALVHGWTDKHDNENNEHPFRFPIEEL